MIRMSAEEIQAHYGEFAEKARQEPVIHTAAGRPTLVTISFDEAARLPGLREILSREQDADASKTLLDYLGKGRKWSRFSSDEEIETHIRAQRDAWR